MIILKPYTMPALHWRIVKKRNPLQQSAGREAGSYMTSLNYQNKLDAEVTAKQWHDYLAGNPLKAKELSIYQNLEDAWRQTSAWQKVQLAVDLNLDSNWIGFRDAIIKQYVIPSIGLLRSDVLSIWQGWIRGTSTTEAASKKLQVITQAGKTRHARAAQMELEGIEAFIEDRRGNYLAQLIYDLWRLDTKQLEAYSDFNQHLLRLVSNQVAYGQYFKVTPALIETARQTALENVNDLAFVYLKR